MVNHGNITSIGAISLVLLYFDIVPSSAKPLVTLYVLFFFLQSTLGWCDNINAAIHCHNFASGLGIL